MGRIAGWLAGSALFAGACAPAAKEPQWSGVLITLDTTNASALGLYAPERAGLTPELEALAADGIVFENARTVAPLTLPAHASMLTGLYPLRHGVRANALNGLPQSARTIAEEAQALGYQTAAFVSAVVLAAPYGLAQGFDVYDDPRQDRAGSGLHIAERSALETVAQARVWLATQLDRTRPFFLWVHLFDPHAPYEPPAAALKRAGGDAYLGEVAATDDSLGSLLRDMRSYGLFDSTLIVVVADHGESLGRRGEPTHSVLCYDDTLLVPLIARRPDGEGRGTRSQATVSVTDVAPTFLEAWRLPVPSALDGISLFASAKRATLPGQGSERGVYFESYDGYLNYGWSPITGWTDGRTKYLHGTAPELFDLARDPLETQDLAASDSAGVARARAALEALARAPRLERGAAAGAELTELVGDLGYATAGASDAELPEPLASTGLPDPRGRMQELAAFYHASLAAERGELDAAIRELETVLTSNPSNAAAHSVLVTCLTLAGRFEAVLTAVQRMPQHLRDRTNVQDSLGHALEGLERHADALACFQRADRLKPDDLHTLNDLLRLHVRLQRTADANAARTRLAQLQRR